MKLSNTMFPRRTNSRCARLDVATSGDELIHLQRDWKELHRSLTSTSTIFQTWEWCYSWWSVFGRHYLKLATFYSTEQNRVAAIAPLALRECGAPGQSTIEAILLGSRESDYLDCLITPASGTAFVEAVIDGLQHMAVSRLILTDIPPWSVFADALQVVAKRQRRSLTCTPSEVCPFIDLPNSWMDYIRSQSSNKRQQMMRKRRKLAQQGAAFRVCESTSDLLTYRDALFELHHSWWARKFGEDSVIANTEMRSFLEEVIGRLYSAGKVHLSVQCGTHGVASVFLTFLHESIFYYYMSGIDPRYAHVSPGFSHLSFLVQDAIAGNFKQVDLLRGEEAYKYRWSNGANRTLSYVLTL